MTFPFCEIDMQIFSFHINLQQKSRMFLCVLLAKLPDSQEQALETN